MENIFSFFINNKIPKINRKNNYISWISNESDIKEEVMC
jgi:hypothetical protein